jgi:hypothetical protein
MRSESGSTAAHVATSLPVKKLQCGEVQLTRGWYPCGRIMRADLETQKVRARARSVVVAEISMRAGIEKHVVERLQETRDDK